MIKALWSCRSTYGWWSWLRWNRWWWVWQLPMGNSGQGSGRDQEIVATLPICKILWSALPGKFSLVQNHLYASTHLIVSPTLSKRKMITLSYQPSEKPSVFVHIMSSPCPMHHANDYDDSLESLHDHVPKEILPEEFGGMQGNFDNSTCANRSINNKIYFTQLQRINE